MPSRSRLLPLGPEMPVLGRECSRHQALMVMKCERDPFRLSCLWNMILRFSTNRKRQDRVTACKILVWMSSPCKVLGPVPDCVRSGRQLVSCSAMSYTQTVRHCTVTVRRDSQHPLYYWQTIRIAASHIHHRLLQIASCNLVSLL